MAGIYLHIPFCKTRCIYCDFYSTVRGDLKQRYVEALCSELWQRRNYLVGPVETVYLGGGTPSLLAGDDFLRLFEGIEAAYGPLQAGEVTLEANPDDLTDAYVEMLSGLPFNRISIGIQTFDEAMLKRLNRRHTARQAVEAVERCRRAGFNNLSIDLIYGLPGETAEAWANDLEQALALAPTHISAYHLTYEEGTPLHRMLRQGRVREVDEERSLLFFRMLTARLREAGYDHYEISNFCLPGCHSRHNSAYWQGIHYLGCGPSAHSFDGKTREWNVASLERYLCSVEEGRREHETECLDLNTRYNEAVMTALRTRCGLSVDEVRERYGRPLLNHLLRSAHPHLEGGRLMLEEGRLRLTEEGVFVSDGIISDLMYVE